jgi:hypothetical protein
VVDDAIVVVEAVEHHIEEGMSPRDASFKAMEEVSSPVIMAIAIILSAVFIPTAFMPGITGRLYQQFAVTIAVSVVISAFNALTLSPALSALLLRPKREGRGPLAAFFRWFNRGFGRATDGYVTWSHHLIRKSVFSMLLLVVVTVVALADKSDNAGICPSPLPPVCPARLPARRPSQTSVLWAWPRAPSPRRGRGVAVSESTLVRLSMLFGSLSLVSFGGGNTVLPAMHREAVEAQHWLTDRQFADLFALAQAAPGPSSLLVSLIGFAAAGITGAVVATVAMLGPSCALVYGACQGWERLPRGRQAGRQGADRA